MLTTNRIRFSKHVSTDDPILASSTGVCRYKCSDRENHYGDGDADEN